MIKKPPLQVLLEGKASADSSHVSILVSEAAELDVRNLFFGLYMQNSVRYKLHCIWCVCVCVCFYFSLRFLCCRRGRGGVSFVGQPRQPKHLCDQN